MKQYFPTSQSQIHDTIKAPFNQWSLNKFSYSLILLLFCFKASAQPSINSFTPASGPLGTAVMITGNNFSPSVSNNTVYFGATRAIITNATSTSLTVTVPLGASYQPISVTTNNLTTFSKKPFIVTFAGGGAINTGSFAGPVNVSSSSVSTVGINDLDGDGKVDIIATSGNSIEIYRNIGSTGTISFSSPVSLTQTGCSVYFAIGDLDGDGNQDIVTTSYCTEKITIFKNTSSPGAISFAPGVEITVSEDPYHVMLTDVNADGLLDIAFSRLDYGVVCVLKNTTSFGIISFASEVSFSVGNDPREVSTGDIDGDGKVDIITAIQYVSAFSVLRNTSSGGLINFANKTTFSCPGSPQTAAVSDLDGDGKPDIAVTDNAGYAISIFRNTSTIGNVTFATRQDIPTGDTTYPYNIAIADLDGDGKPDLLIANQRYTSNTNTMQIYRNTSTPGSISFGPKADYHAPIDRRFIAIGDLDLDGKPDILNNNTPSGLQVLINKVDGANITSFSPLAAATGDTVTIKGTNFSSATGVTFGGTAAFSFIIVSDSLIKAVISTGTTGAVSVIAPKGTGTLGGFTYSGNNAAIPTITSFSPTSGPIGTSILINGKNFDPIASNNIVYFGAVKANISSASSTILNVIVPQGAGFQPITATTKNLTAYSTGIFIVTFPGSDLFTASSFATKKDFQTGANPYSVISCDLNLDSKPDVVTTNIASNSISLLNNNGAGDPVSLAGKIDSLTESQPVSCSTGDFDGDGKLDVCVANVGNNSFSIMRNNTNGPAISLATKINFPTPNSPRSIMVNDFDKDGKPDVIVANYSANSISIYKNISSGPSVISFATKMDYTTGTQPTNIATGDFDNDGKVDIAVSNFRTDSISIFRNTSSGPGNISFALKTDYPSGVQPMSISSGDFDRDGHLDIAVTNYGANSISILRNTSSAQGNISFALKTEYITGTNPSGISITDLNGDGKPDIVVTNVFDANVSVFRNASNPGSISFSEKVDYPTGNNPRNLFIEDMNGDGKPEILTANYNDNTVSILRNTIALKSPGQLCPGSNTSFVTNLTGTSYQWQQSISGNFLNINDNPNFTGTNSSNLELKNIPSSWYGYKYRCLIDGTPGNLYTLSFVNYWTGAINSQWENPANWSCGTLPDSNSDVFIPGGTVILNSSTFIRSITIKPGASLTIQTGFVLTVNH